MNQRLQNDFKPDFIRSNKKIESYFLVGSDEVLFKIILESLIHINTLNEMEINLLS